MNEQMRGRSWWARMFGTEPGEEIPISEAEEIAEEDVVVEIATPPDPPALPPTRSDTTDRILVAEQRAEADRIRAAALERDYDLLREAYSRLEARAQNSESDVTQLRAAAAVAQQRMAQLEGAAAQANAQGNAEHLDKARRALLERDRRIEAQAAELETARTEQRKATAALADARRQLEGLGSQTQRHVAELETQLEAARRGQADAEHKLQAQAAEQERAREAVTRNEAAHRALAAETAQLRRDAATATRSARDAAAAVTHGEEALAKATAELAALRLVHDKASARMTVLRAFAAAAVGHSADALQDCVGGRAALPLARSWRRRPMTGALVPETPHAPERLAAALTEHLDTLGIAARGDRQGSNIVLEGALEAGPPSPAFEASVAWLAEYLRAWLQSAEGREYTLAEFQTASDERRFSLTFA